MAWMGASEHTATGYDRPNPDYRNEARVEQIALGWESKTAEEQDAMQAELEKLIADAGSLRNGFEDWAISTRNRIKHKLESN